jgi:hypothetical protein
MEQEGLPYLGDRRKWWICYGLGFENEEGISDPE